MLIPTIATFRFLFAYLKYSPRQAFGQVFFLERPDFQFTAKLYRVFTHERILNKHDVRNYRDGIAPLVEDGRLGCLLMQFPWSFRYSRENQQYLRRVKQTFGDYPLVAELRHASWNSEEALSVLRENEIGFANIDQPHLHHCFPATDYATSSIGCVFRYSRENQQYLRRLKKTFGDYPLVAELRHASWNSEEALSVLRENEIGFANIDYAARFAAACQQQETEPRSRCCVSPHFSSADGQSTRQARHYFVALARRAHRTVQVRLRAPSGARLVLTGLSCTLPRHPMRNAG